MIVGLSLVVLANIITPITNTTESVMAVEQLGKTVDYLQFSTYQKISNLIFIVMYTLGCFMLGYSVTRAIYEKFTSKKDLDDSVSEVMKAIKKKDDIVIITKIKNEKGEMEFITNNGRGFYRDTYETLDEKYKTVLIDDDVEMIVYLKNGKLHREDGPAIVYKSGRGLWYFGGELLAEEDTNKNLRFIQ